MKFKERDVDFRTLENVLGFVDNWYDLAMIAGIQPKLLSYVLRNKKAFEPGEPGSVYSFWQIKDRCGFYSSRELKFIQERISVLLYGVYNSMEKKYVDSIWAYMKKTVVMKKLKSFEKRKLLITFDIVKYFDTISFSHVKTALKRFGFTERGAKLVTRYLVVTKPRSEKGPQTLQQGSVASPLVSNLVGHHYFDIPLHGWIEEQKRKYPKADIKIGRYCDNIGISIDGEIDIEMIRDLRKFIKKIMNDSGFRYHKFSAIPMNHPKANQYFLGVVLNYKSRLSKDVYHMLRSILFNACTNGLKFAASDYCFDNPCSRIEDRNEFFDLAETEKLMFVKAMTGKIAYIKHINKKHYDAMRKLLSAARLLDCLFSESYKFDPKKGEFRLDDGMFDAVKLYKNDDIDERRFLRNIVDCAIRSGVPRDLIVEKVTIGRLGKKEATKIINVVSGLIESDELAA